MGASRQKVEVALIKGYLFIEADLEVIGTEFWRRLRNVFGWVNIDGKPLPIPRLQIEAIQFAESIGDYDETSRLLRDLQSLIGRKFFITDGILTGHNVVVNAADEREVTVSVINSELRAKIPVDFWRNISQISHLDDQGMN